MYSDSDDEEKIDDLWSFHPPVDEEESEEQKKEEILARKKSHKILESM